MAMPVVGTAALHVRRRRRRAPLQRRLEQPVRPAEEAHSWCFAAADPTVSCNRGCGSFGSEPCRCSCPLDSADEDLHPCHPLAPERKRPGAWHVEVDAASAPAQVRAIK